MKATPLLYLKLSLLFILLSGVIGFNFAVWGLRRYPKQPLWQVPVADPERGRLLIQAYGCGTCHTVPGVRSATGQVGPRLDQLREKIYVAGVLPNSPQNLAFWIQNPQEVDPRTAMPDLGVAPEEARDMAAYLYEVP